MIVKAIKMVRTIQFAIKACKLYAPNFSTHVMWRFTLTANLPLLSERVHTFWLTFRHGVDSHDVCFNSRPNICSGSDCLIVRLRLSLWMNKIFDINGNDDLNPSSMISLEIRSLVLPVHKEVYCSMTFELRSSSSNKTPSHLESSVASSTYLGIASQSAAGYFYNLNQISRFNLTLSRSIPYRRSVRY